MSRIFGNAAESELDESDKVAAVVVLVVVVDCTIIVTIVLVVVIRAIAGVYDPHAIVKRKNQKK